MVTEFKFPDVGEGIQEGEIVAWRVKVHDQVAMDQVLAEVETDKAVVELPSPVAGTILQLHVKAGDTIAVGETLVTIGEPDESLPEPKSQTPSTPKEAPEDSGSVVGTLPEEDFSDIYASPATDEGPRDLLDALQPSQVSTSIKAMTLPQPVIADEGRRVLALPSTRRLARDLGVSLQRIKGTGPKDRITDADVRQHAFAHGQTFIDAPPSISQAPFFGGALRDDAYGLIETVPLKGIRRATARRMVEAASTAVLVTHTDEADVTLLRGLRNKEKQRAAQQNIKLSYLPYIIKAVIAALKKHPSLNASLDESVDEIQYRRYYNIGVAVDTPDGLIVPVIKNADRITLYQVAEQLGIFVSHARDRTISLEDLRGGTFTITNVGVYGGIFATPIVNPPQAAIIATGAIRPQPRVVEDTIQIRYVLPLSLSFDHRIIDGAEAARFTNTIINYLETPAWIFMDDEPEA